MTDNEMKDLKAQILAVRTDAQEDMAGIEKNYGAMDKVARECFDSIARDTAEYYAPVFGALFDVSNETVYTVKLVASFRLSLVSNENKAMRYYADKYNEGNDCCACLEVESNANPSCLNVGVSVLDEKSKRKIFYTPVYYFSNEGRERFAPEFACNEKERVIFYALGVMGIRPLVMYTVRDAIEEERKRISSELESTNLLCC